MDEDRMQETFKKVENVLLVVVLVVMFFFGYTYNEENSIGLLLCYVGLFSISATVIVFSTITMSKDDIREQFKLDDPVDLLEEIKEEIEETIQGIKELIVEFFKGNFKEWLKKLKTFVATRKKSVLYSPLCIFSLLGILSYFGLSVSDEDKGVIPLAFALFVTYNLQTAPLNYKKKCYISNSLEKINEFTEVARNAREEGARVLTENNEFSIDLWKIQNQSERVAMENIKNHSEVVTIFSGTHTMRDRVAPVLTSIIGVLTWIMRMRGGLF